MLNGINNRGIQTQELDILAYPDSGDAYLAGKVAFVLGLAGLYHPGVFLGPEVSMSQCGNAHRPLDKRIAIDDILSVQTEYVLRNDRTVAHNRKIYQVTDNTRARKVVVFEYLNGHMAVKYGQTGLNYKAIDLRSQPELKI